MEARALHYKTFILLAEAWGMKEGVRAAITYGLKNVCVESDNLIVINSLRKV